MKNFFLFIFFIFFSLNSFSQDSLRKVSIRFTSRNDLVSTLALMDHNKDNNASTKFIGYLGEADLMVKFNTKDLKLWNNGKFFFQALASYGHKPSANAVKDFQVFSNIEAPTHLGFYELWYEHKIKDVTLRLGQLDMNADFMVNDYSGNLINSAFGVISTFSANVPSSIYPMVAPGLLVNYDVNDRIAVRTALYKGNPGSFDDGNAFHKIGLSWDYKGSQSLLSMSELQLSYKKINGSYTSAFRVGTAFHTIGTDFAPLAYSSTVFNYYYATINHQAFKFDSIRGIGVFVTVGFVPAKQTPMKYSVGGGLNFKGVFRQENNYLSISFASLVYDKKARTQNLLNPMESKATETIIEGVLSVQVMKQLAIKPDLQYIIHPGLTTLNANVLVGLLRVVFSFSNNKG